MCILPPGGTRTDGAVGPRTERSVVWGCESRPAALVRWVREANEAS